MRCQSIRNLLSPYIDLVLSEEEKTKVEKHLATCKYCRQDLAELQSAVKRIRDLEKLEAPSSFMNELHERLLHEKVTPFNKRGRKNHLVGSTTGWFAASAASIALVVGIYISSLVPFPMVASFFDKIPQIIAPKDGNLSRDIERFLKEKEQQMHAALNITQPDRNEGNKGPKQVVDNKQPQQVAVNPEVDPEDPVAQPMQPMLINTVSLQMMAGETEQVTDNIMQLAKVNEAQVETANTQLMAGVSKVMTVRVSPEKVDSIVAGVKSFGCQTEPMQGVQDVSEEYGGLKNRLVEVELEITRLQGKKDLDADESDKLRAMLFEKSYLKDKIADLEEKTKLVAVNVMITEEPNH